MSSLLSLLRCNKKWRCIKVNLGSNPQMQFFLALDMVPFIDVALWLKYLEIQAYNNRKIINQYVAAIYTIFDSLVP